MNRHKGFTLLELMVTLVIMGIMAAFALPAMNQFMERQRIRSTLSNYVNALTFARNEAIRQNLTVAVTGGNISSAGQLANASAAWTEGVLVYADVNNNNTYQANTDRNIRVVLSANRPNAQAADNKLNINATLVSTAGAVFNDFNGQIYMLPNGQIARLSNGILVAGDAYLQLFVQSNQNQQYSNIALLDPTGQIIRCSKQFLGSNKNAIIDGLCTKKAK